MGKVSALVVDDATFIRDLLKKGLRDNFPGVEVTEAVNGRKAQQILERQDIDLILCDWEMPEMSGLELLTWCREQDRLKQVPFIMVTSRGDKENVIQAIQAGVSDYIGKPFTSEQMISKVKKAMLRVGKLQELAADNAPKVLSSGGFANDSLAALTGGRPAASVSAAPTRPVAAPAPAAAKPSASDKAPSGRGTGQIRLPNGTLDCVIRSISLKDALLAVRRTDAVPQVLASAVLDLQGEGESARLNGYLHAVAAFEPHPESQWLQLTFKFVDADPQKLDYLSRLIAQGSAQKHFVPGA